MRRMTLLCYFLMMMIFVGCQQPVASEPEVHIHEVPQGSSSLITALTPVKVAATEPDQVVYQIDPHQSIVRYRVEEVIFGTIEGRMVAGTTSHVAGNMMIDWREPARSRLGAVTVDLATFTSDSTLRDKRLQTSYLESAHYPQATFVPDHEAIEWPSKLSTAKPVTFMLPGTLTIRETTRQITWQVTLTPEAGQIIGFAETTILMSDFGIGPIQVIGLLETKDTIDLSLDFVATTNPTEPLIMAEQNIITSATVQAGVPEFFADIEPILAENCVACHQEGQIGHEVYALETARDAVEVADDLAFVTQMRNMPPWPASNGNPSFRHDRRLSDDDINTIGAWASAGAPIQGNLDQPLETTALAAEPIRVDRSLSMSTAYTPDLTNQDDYRCFVVDPQFEKEQFITGYEIIPGNLRTVHHVIAYLVEREALAQVAKMEALDESPGWTCFGGPSVNSSVELGATPLWVPGQIPVHLHENTGIPVGPDTLFVMQVHYNIDVNSVEEAEPDQTALELQLAPIEADLRPLLGFDAFGPVEIPCPTGINTPQCTRDIALQKAIATEALEAEMEEEIFLFLREPTIAEQLLIFCNRQVSEFINQGAEQVVSHCDLTVGINGFAPDVIGHMHTLGKTLRMELNPDTPEAQVLLDIDRWDFNWQYRYTFVDPIRVEQGDVVRITCTWDNSPDIAAGPLAEEPYRANRAQTWQERIGSMFHRLIGVRTAYAHNSVNPEAYRYILWGEGTNDEMCLGTFSIIPDEGFEDADVYGPTPLITTVRYMFAMLQPVFLPLVGLIMVVTITGGAAWRRRRRSR